MIKQHIRLNTVETCVTVLNLSKPISSLYTGGLSRYVPVQSRRMQAPVNQQRIMMTDILLPPTRTIRHNPQRAINRERLTAKLITPIASNTLECITEKTFSSDPLNEGSTVGPRTRTLKTMMNIETNATPKPQISLKSVSCRGTEGTYPYSTPLRVSRYPDTDLTDTKRTPSRGIRRISG
jgi:hypothetical protein